MPCHAGHCFVSEETINNGTAYAEATFPVSGSWFHNSLAGDIDQVNEKSVITGEPEILRQ